MAALGMAVRSLDDLAPVLARIAALGRRHAGYGVKAADFTTVGAAFLATLAAGLGDDFTPAARTAWTHAYETLAGAMIAAMADPAANAA
jgi:hemoglobin-like flavoprotein